MKSWLPKITGPKTINRQIFRAAFLVGMLTLLAKCGATVKELLVARWFGRSDALDAFLIAYLVPAFVVALVTGALSSALIPTFILTRRNQGTEAAQKLFSSLLLFGLLALSSTAVLLALLAPYYLPYLGSGFSPAKLHFTRELLYTLLPLVLFGGIASFASAVLNAGERFALPALAPLLTPLVTIVFLEFGAARWGAFSLVAGALAGGALEAALLGWSLSSQGLRFSVRWHGMDAALRRVLAQCAPMLGGALLMGGTSIVDQSMAAMLAPGSVAALNYANKITGVILSLGTVGLSTALLAYFSKMVAENDWSGCRHTLKRYSVLIVCTAVPLTAFVMTFSKPLVRVLFQRGAFNPADTALVSWVQQCYALQIPFYVECILFVRFLSSIGRNDLLMYGSAINLVLDITLNLILIKWWGVAGIALSTSFVYVIAFVFLSTWSIRLLRRQGLPVAAMAAPSP
jgi:putative peptidoglycan lipid II flippase